MREVYIFYMDTLVMSYVHNRPVRVLDPSPPVKLCVCEDVPRGQDMYAHTFLFACSSISIYKCVIICLNNLEMMESLSNRECQTDASLSHRLILTVRS